jgi:hypothetical protein
LQNKIGAPGGNAFNKKEAEIGIFRFEWLFQKHAGRLFSGCLKTPEMMPEGALIFRQFQRHQLDSDIHLLHQDLSRGPLQKLLPISRRLNFPRSLPEFR